SATRPVRPARRGRDSRAARFHQTRSGHSPHRGPDEPAQWFYQHPLPDRSWERRPVRRLPGRFFLSAYILLVAVSAILIARPRCLPSPVVLVCVSVGGEGGDELTDRRRMLDWESQAGGAGVPHPGLAVRAVNKRVGGCLA